MINTGKTSFQWPHQQLYFVYAKLNIYLYILEKIWSICGAMDLYAYCWP